MVKNPHVMDSQEMLVRSLGQEDPLEKELAIHSGILAWRIPWTQEPGGLQSRGSQRLRDDFSSIQFSRSVMSNSLQPHGLQHARLLCPWDSPGKNTRVDCHVLLQGIFSTQGLNLRLCLLHCWQVGSLPLSHVGSPPRSHKWSLKKALREI